jgi:hypothetical protein
MSMPNIPLPTYVGDILGFIQLVIQNGSTNLWKTAPEALENVVKAFWPRLPEAFQMDEEKIWRDGLNWFVQAGILQPGDVNQILQLRHAAHPFDWVFYLAVLSRLFFTYLTATTEPATLKAMQSINKMMRPALPSYASAVAAAFIAPEKTGEVRDILARLGFTEADIDLIFISHYRLYDEFVVRDLYWRKILTEDQVFTRMRELGYTDTRIKEMTQAWTLIPPAQDILMMVGKEAFEPDSIQRMGLDQEFPSEQGEWLEKQGLSPYWQKKYWIAHWDQPSIQMGYEMLQRGIINREDLEFLFKTVEIPPFWREKLLKIAYTPYTRVDARRMHALKVLSDEELIVSFMDIGYDRAHAEKMAEFTKRLNAGKEKDLTKAEVLKGYRERIVTRKDATDFLLRLQYDETEAAYYLDMEDYKLQSEIQDDIQSTIQQRYQNRLIERSDAQRQLDELGLPSAQVRALLDKWEVKVLGADKVPSKTDLEDFLRAGIISSDTYRREMARLGYAFQYVEWFEAYASAQGPRFQNKKGTT